MPRFVDLSNYYCAALGPTGVQIQTKVGGNALNSAIFPQSINIGSIQQMKLSLSAAGVLSVTLNSSVRGTLTPAALSSGFAAVATTSMEASFDTIVVYAAVGRRRSGGAGGLTGSCRGSRRDADAVASDGRWHEPRRPSARRSGAGHGYPPPAASGWQIPPGTISRDPSF